MVALDGDLTIGGAIQPNAVNDIGLEPESDNQQDIQDPDKSNGTKQSQIDSEKAISQMISPEKEESPEKSESLQISQSGDKTQAVNDQIENILAKQKQAPEESAETSQYSQFIPIPPQSDRYFKTHRSMQLQPEFQNNQGLVKRSAMNVFAEAAQNISKVEGQKPLPSHLPTAGGGLGVSHLGKRPVSSLKRVGTKESVDDQTSESQHDFDGTHHLAYEDYRSAQFQNSMKRQAEAGLPIEMYMPVKDKNPFRRRKEYYERIKELNNKLLTIDRFENFNALTKEEQIRWRKEEQIAKEEEQAQAKAQEDYFEPVFSRELIPTQRQIAKAKHDASIAKAKKALARKKSKIGNQLQALQQNKLISEEFIDGSDKSELSSNKSYQYGRERSRQILNLCMGEKLFNFAIAHQNDIFEEQIRLQMERHVPLADWYVSKVLNRVERTMAGENLGDLVESELEDLEIDNEFELQRNQVENVSSYNNTEEQMTPRSEGNYESKSNVRAQIFSERLNYRELGRSPPLTITSGRTGAIDLVKQAMKSEVERKLEFMDKIQKKMSHRILKIMIQKNCKVRILKQQRLEQEAKQRQQALFSQDQGLREHRHILQLQIVPLIRDLQAGTLPSHSQQVLYQSHASKRGSSQFNQHPNAQRDQLIEMSESYNYMPNGKYIFQDESKSEYLRRHTAQQLNYHGSQKYFKPQNMLPEVTYKKNRRSSQTGNHPRSNKTPSQRRPTQVSAERGSQKSIQSKKSSNVRQSSKSSEVFIKEDNEPSLGKNESQKLFEQKSQHSSVPENLQTNNQELEFQQILAQGKEISESDLHQIPQPNSYDDPRNKDLIVDQNEPVRTNTQGPQGGYLDLRQEGIMRRTPGLQGSFIDIDRSYELVNGMKQQIQDYNSKLEHFEHLKSRDGSQVSKKNRSGENNLFNIDIDKNLETSKSPTRQLNEIQAQHEIVPFDNSPEIQDKKKWKEVMQFMESNPQIMMNVLPPTPGRKFKQPPQNQEALSQSRSRSPYGGPTEKQLNDGTSFGESFYDPQNNNLRKNQDDYLLDQTAMSGNVTRPATSANMTRFITPSQNQNSNQIGPKRLDRPSTTVNAGQVQKPNGPAQRIYGNVPDQLKNKSQRMSRAQIYERRLSALTNQNQNMTNAALSDDQQMAQSPPQSNPKFRNKRSKGQQNFLKTQQAYHSNTKMLDQNIKRQQGNKPRVLAAGVAPLPPKALQIGQQESQKNRVSKLNQMYPGQKQSNINSRPSTGMGVKSVEKQFYHQNVDINYIEKDLYIQDVGIDSQITPDVQITDAQHARSKSLAQMVPNRTANNTQVMQLNEEQRPLSDPHQQYGMKLQKKQRASSGWYRNGKIEQQQQNAFFLKRNMQGQRDQSAGYQIKHLKVNKQSFSGPKQFSMYQKNLSNVDSKAMIRMSKKDLGRSQANSIKQWPRVAESHQLLQSALKDVEILNENRPDKQTFERQLQQLNVSSTLNSPQTRTQKNKVKIEVPTSANFYEFNSGIRESILRLNPQMVQRSMKHRPLSNRKGIKHSPSRSPKKDDSKSRSKSGQKGQQMSQKKHKQHEKRLEKLQKLRKSMKNISSPRFQNKDSARQPSVRSKKQSPKKTDENYKVITQEKSVFDIRKAGPEIGTLVTGSQGLSPRQDEGTTAKEIETIPRQSIEQDQNNLLTPISQHDVEDDTPQTKNKKDFRSSKQKLSNQRRPSTVKQKRPSQQFLEQDEVDAESPVKSFRQRQVLERRMSSSDMTEQTKGALGQAELEKADKHTGEREGSLPIDDSNSSMTKKTIGIIDLRNSKEDSSKAVSFMMEPPSSHGFKRSRTGIEVNVEHPGAQLAHENRRSRSKHKKKRKSPESKTDSKSSKKDRKSTKSPSRGREGSSSSYELRRVKKKKKRLGSGKDRSDSKERKSSLEHNLGTMPAAGPGNFNQESAKDYIISDDKYMPQFGVENIDFTKMSQDEIVKQFALQQQFFIDQYQEWQKKGMSPKSLQIALSKFQGNQTEQPTEREASQPQNVSQQKLNESLLDHKKSLDKASDTYQASLYTDYQDKLIRFDWSKTDIFQKVLVLPRFKNPGITEVIEHQIMSNIHNLRKAPGHHQRAHILMPMFEQAMDYLEDLLCERLHLRRLFFKIKAQYVCIDYQNTLKLLVRAKLCGQLREDMTLVLCKYLDFMEELKQIQQLRDDPSSIKDEILKIQINKMQKHGGMFLQRAQQFQTTYAKVFKEGNIWVGDSDIITEVAIILQKFGVLQKEYNALIP